ncbi:MAG: VanZ family protein, partial [Gemmatimonadaceae bacterium]
ADATAERLGLATLSYVAATTLVITLAPFRFSTKSMHGLSTEWTAFDLVMNVVMFVPLGFLYRVTRPRGAATAWWMAIVLGGLLSASIESAQMFEATRYSSLLDILTNTTGAAVGSWLFTRLSHRLRIGAAAVSTLALELPLMGLVYLLIPLLWLTGLSSAGSERAWLLIPMAAFGGAIIGAVHGAYLEPEQRVGALGLILSSGAWFLVASIPGGRHQPMVIVSGMFVAVGSAWIRSAATTRERLRQGAYRFELPTLRLVMPLFAAYLALSALWPITEASGAWHAGFGFFPALRGEISQQLVFQALEYSAAFTVSGYIIAEFHGRTSDGYRAVLGLVFRWGGALAVMLELARGWHAAMGASVLMGALAIAASVFGGWLYHLQRDHVRALWARDRGQRNASVA